MKKEITIIGAGSTGLSAAVFLHQLGYDPRIVEKRERVKITKALGINPVTLQLFESSGITERFIRNGWKMECSNFWYNHELIYKNHFSKIKHPYPFMIIQPQFETEQIIEDCLLENGILVERNMELESITAYNDSTRLSFLNNSMEPFLMDTNGVVIGADGSKSKVRAELNIPFDGWEHPTPYTLYDIELETSLADNEGHYMFFKDGAMIMLHIRDGVWRVGGNLQDVLNYLPKGTKAGKISWETTFTISEKVARHYSEGNIHLMGDAAHIHSPLGAKGMNMCIEDSYIFANLFHQNKENTFSKVRRNKVKQSIGLLGQLTEVAAGKHFVGNTFRSNMKRCSFMFPIVMPYMRKFLLGLK